MQKPSIEGMPGILSKSPKGFCETPVPVLLVKPQSHTQQKKTWAREVSTHYPTGTINAYAFLMIMRF